MKTPLIIVIGLLVQAAGADPVRVRHVQGYLHGFIALRDLDDKLLASGDLTQRPKGNRVTTTMTLHFRDGSLYQDTAVFSQQKQFRLLSFKHVHKGASFKEQQTLAFDSSGKISVRQTDEKGKEHAIDDKLTLPPDLANGILSTLLTNVDPNVETTLSMLVATPKPRVVKLKIAPAGQDSFSVGGMPGKAQQYVIKFDLGGLTGVAAKIVGKQPPPINMWIASGDAPVFLKSEGALYEDGPIWRIQLASPTWPKNVQKR